MCGHAMKHAIDTDVLIYVGPVDTLAGTDQAEVRPLLRCGIGQAPGPGQRYADDAAVHEPGDNYGQERETSGTPPIA